MSSGGLLQLIAVGEEDKYLNETPTVNFFDVTYQRYENYGREPVVSLFTGQARDKSTISIDIPRTADMLHKVYLRLKVNWTITTDGVSPPDDQKQLLLNIKKNCKDVIGFNTFFKSATLSIGGREIQSIDGHLATLYDSSKTHFSTVQRQSLFPTQLNDEYVYVPLNFWFTDTISQSLPLISLAHQTARITVELAGGTENSWELVNEKFAQKEPKYTLTADITNADAVFDMFYLSNEMRQKFATEERQYLIHQYQTVTSSVVGTEVQVPINFKHPVSCIFWNVVEDGGAGKDSAVTHCQLSANGVDMTPRMDNKYFKYITNYQSINDKDPGKLGYYMYSWAKDPLSIQPNGTLNFSRLESAALKISLESSKKDKVTVNAINFNVLKFVSGMAGLMFS